MADEPNPDLDDPLMSAVVGAPESGDRVRVRFLSFSGPKEKVVTWGSVGFSACWLNEDGTQGGCRSMDITSIERL